MFLMRFDMRSDDAEVPRSDLYRAAIEMAEWAETRGALAATLSEHHGTDDGYLPAPLVLAAAIAARTSTLPIMIAAIPLPLYDPIRLAEEMTVLDHLSGGRVSYVAGLGYVPSEYARFGVDFARRGTIADEHLDVLLRAKAGDTVERFGQTHVVTPRPLTQGGPSVAWGGGSPAAARRAGRRGLDFFSQGGPDGLAEVYADAAAASGRTVGTCAIPARDTPTAVFVADDVDRAWDEVGPYLLSDARAYAALNPSDTSTAAISTATTVDELRAERASHRIVDVDGAVELVRSGVIVPLHPLIGGLRPDVAWRYLRVVTDEMMPSLG